MLSRGISSGLFCLLAFTSGITAQCLFGPGCKYACNCKQGVNCNSMTGCNGQCTDGFDGPKCQRQNVALDKRTEQQPGTYCSSKNDPDTCLNSHYAVDGKLDTTIDFNKKACTFTEEVVNNPSWMVNLGQTYAIFRFVIYNRNEPRPNGGNFGDRLRGFKLQVGYSGNNFRECYQDRTANGSPGNVIEKHCQNNQPLLGDTVRISTSNGEPLTLCEVILYVCANGWYGEECDKQCQSPGGCASCDTKQLNCATCSANRWGSDCNSRCFCENGSACDKLTGHCPGRCAPGYQGTACNQDCSFGYYGLGCQTKCGNCYTPGCNRFSGTCSSSKPMCTAGFQPPKCDIECPYGRYGADCLETCGNCKNGNTLCDKQNGRCRDGCAAGWKGGFCKKECPDGNYGPDCTESCGNCRRNSNSCDKQDGSCRDGCAAGWKGNVCKQTCDGSFGINCTTQCGKCANETMCNQVNGECPEAVANPRCAAGWMNNTCLTRCPDGLYGSDCKESCGNCRNDTAFCNKENGHCHGGCTAGWKGGVCRQECPDGNYGPDCTESCGNCRRGNNSCDKQDGSCRDGCGAGWKGNVCKQVCDGYFGIGCKTQCGKCANGTQCDHVTGECPNTVPRCAAGEMDEKCLTKETSETEPGESTSTPPLTIVGGVIGGVVVAVVIAVTFYYLGRRKRRGNNKETDDVQVPNRQLQTNAADVPPPEYSNIKRAVPNPPGSQGTCNQAMEDETNYYNVVNNEGNGVYNQYEHIPYKPSGSGQTEYETMRVSEGGCGNGTD